MPLPLVVLAVLLSLGPATAGRQRSRAPFRPRRLLVEVVDGIELQVSPANLTSLPATVRLTVAGVQDPSPKDLVALYPAGAALNESVPIKWNWAAIDDNYTAAGAGSYTFEVMPYNTDVRFVLVRGAVAPAPQVLAVSEPLVLPNVVNQVHLASTGMESEMRVTWLTRLPGKPLAKYGTQPGKYEQSVRGETSTYEREDLCGGPASELGYKPVGTINTAVMTGLQPNTRYFYVVGDEAAGWSEEASFLTPRRPDDYDAQLKLLATADLGQFNADESRSWVYTYDLYDSESYLDPADFPAFESMDWTVLQVSDIGVNQEASQDGSILTIPALVAEAESGAYHGIWHNGDLSYARGQQAQWDNFFSLMEPVASRMPYMVSAGNHERDQPGSGDRFNSTSVRDSGGECGVPTQRRFIMPEPWGGNGTQPPGPPTRLWYSVDQGPVHFLQLCTELPFDQGSEQYKFAADDLAAVNRSRTPWVVVGFHRMMYTDSYFGFLPTSSQVVAADMRAAFEDLFFLHSVDMTWQGHLHVFQRTFPVYSGTSLGYDSQGVAKGPVHITMGNAGYSLTPFFEQQKPAAFDAEYAGFGYMRATVNRTAFAMQMVDSANGTVVDEFTLTKPAGWQPPSLAQRQAEMRAIKPTPISPGLNLAGWYLAFTFWLPALAKLNANDTRAALGPGSVSWQVANDPQAPMGTPLLRAIIEEATGLLDGLAAQPSALQPFLQATNLSEPLFSYLFDGYAAVRDLWLTGRIAQFAEDGGQ